MNNQQKMLIIGAGGFVGKSFELYSKDASYEYIYATHTVINKKPNYFTIDIENERNVHEVIRKITPDVIINLAAINSIMAANQFCNRAISVNVLGTVNILEAVKEYCPQSKVLLIGSSEEYEESENKLTEDSKLAPRNIYGLTKLWQEQVAGKYIEMYGLNIICVRAFNHTGIFQSEQAMVSNFCKQVAQIDSGIVKNNVIRCGNLELYRDISDVRDVISAYMSLAKSDKVKQGVYNVCSGKAIYLMDILQTIISFSDKKITIEIDESRVRNNEPKFICGDNTRLKKATGWDNRYLIKETLEHIYESIRRGMSDEKI